MVTSFGTTSSTFINSLKNPNLKYDEISFNIQKLHDSLLIGSLEFPVLNIEYLELLNEDYILTCQEFQQLSYVKYTDSVPNKIGYSPVKIISSPPTNDQRLEEIDPLFLSSNLNLNTIYRRLNRSIVDHKLLLYLFNNLELNLVYNMELSNYTFLTNSFNSIFMKSKYIDYYVTINSQNIISIPYILYYSLLCTLFSRTYNFPHNVLSYINDETLLENEVIVNDFNTYITNYHSEISEDISEYLLNNIFLFGQDVSENIKEGLINFTNELILPFSDLFEELQNVIIPGDMVQILTNDVFDNIINETVLRCMNGTVPGSNYEKSFYELSPLIMDIPETVFDQVKMQEDRIFTNIIDYINDNIDKLADLNIISSQFRIEPLYFLNSFIINYSRFNINLIQDLDAFYLSDVNNWLNTFYTNDEHVISNLKDYLYNTNLVFDEQYSKSLLFPSFLKFRVVINQFCDHDLFKEYIIHTFIPKIYEHIRSQYYININWYEYVDSICNFFKIIFYKHFLEVGVDDKHKLFGNYLDEFSSLIKTFIQDSEHTITDTFITNIVNMERTKDTQFYYVFNSFFKSSITSGYLQMMLQKSYSL